MYKFQRREARQAAKKRRMPKSGKVNGDIARVQAQRVPTAVLQAIECHSDYCSGTLRVPNKRGRCKVCGNQLTKRIK